jgi:hypothetical protein
MDGLMLGREQRAKSKEETSGGEELLEESVLPVLYKRLVHQVSSVVIYLNLFRPLTHSLAGLLRSLFLSLFIPLFLTLSCSLHHANSLYSFVWCSPALPGHP